MSSFWQSFSSIFSGGRSTSTAHSQRRNQAMSSTHDAFSIPNHSPTFQSQSFRDAQDDARYTYPPAPSPNDFSPSTPYSVDGRSPSTSQDSRQRHYTDETPRQSAHGSLLPLHSPMSARHPYPPIDQTWNRIRSWLNRHYPELGDTLNYGILPEDLAEIEMQFGFALPQTIRESYLQVDGQEIESSGSCTEGLFFGLSFLSLEEVLDEWRFWREVDNDPVTGANSKLKERMRSIPAGWTQPDYSNRGWIPLVTDRVGNYIGIDINPGEKGAAGQVIVFGRDFDTKVVMWRGDGEGGWARYLAYFAEELELGEIFEIGTTDRDSDDSEDSIGHEPYFFDGSVNGARGEGGIRGAIGLKLIGEYRGWNVLEALADRAVKRWKDVGLVQDHEYPILDSKRESTSLAGINGLPHESGVEVPIPILEDGPTHDVHKPLPPDPDTPRPRNFNQPIPSIAVHRPAPMPIDLPTSDDIEYEAVRNAEQDTPQEEEDLERGNGRPLTDTSSLPNGNAHMIPLSASDSSGMDTGLFSPRLSEEDSSLLNNSAVAPTDETPITPIVMTGSRSITPTNDPAKASKSTDPLDSPIPEPKGPAVIEAKPLPL